MSAITPGTTLADIVTAHPDLARELEQRSLDYCCGGQKTLDAACAEAGLDAGAVAAELAEVTTASPEPWADMDAAELVDHLERTHHDYLKAELPRLGALADKVAGVHGANHPELVDVRDTVVALRADLEPHMAKEEQVLFPMIRELAAADVAPSFHCGSLQNPISVMLREHDSQAVLLARLRDLTGGFATPADGCASYQALYDGLAQMEEDTHRHVHKENNRLFPMVAELERSLPVA